MKLFGKRITQKQILLGIVPAILLCAAGFVMYWRWRVGMTRFFDVDEFTHLHWAANVARGSHPYTDFFTFFTPGFYWFFGLLIFMFPFNPSVLIASRIVTFFIFVGIAIVLGWIFGMTRSKRYVFIPVILLAFLPMPFDKFLEVRPDNIATLLSLLGVAMEIMALRSQKNTNRWWFWSGMMYMVSLIFLVKQVPFVFMGCVVAVAYAVWAKNDGGDKGNKGNRGRWEELSVFCLGMGIPLAFFIVWLFTLSDMQTVWYSLTALPFEANMISRLGVMEPHLFFFPNGSFYGGTTLITLGFILNHAIWFVGIIAGVLRFFSPFVQANGDRRKALVEVLLSTIFILSVIGYVKFFPLKHSQYLIPIAVFIAYYCADAIVFLFVRVEKKVPFFGVLILVLFGSYYIGVATVQINSVKLGWNNVTQIEQLSLLIDGIPHTDEVLDLEGKLLYWKDTYYICCLPFGSFVQYLSHKPSPLRDVLENKKTPYIYQGDSNRLYILEPDDLAYIKVNYIPVEGWGESLWERKK